MGEEESDSDDDAEGEEEVAEPLTVEEEAAREQAAVPKKIVAETARPILIDPKSVQLRRDVKVEAEVEAMFIGEGYLDMVSKTPTKNWGNFNNRHIQDPHVKALLRCFEETGIAFWEHTIAAVVEDGWMEKTSLAGKDTPMSELQPVVWTAAAAGQVVQVMGGNHRREALLLFREKLDKQIQVLNKRIKPEVLENEKSTEKAVAKMRARMQERDDLVARRETARYWRCAFYRRSEWFTYLRCILWRARY